MSTQMEKTVAATNGSGNGDVSGGHKSAHANGHHKSNGEVEVDKVVVEGFSGVEDTDTSAYMSNYEAHKTGISHQEMVKAYTQWAPKYDQDLCPGRYNGPEIAAKAVANYYWESGQLPEEELANLRILDVAAGTGRVGVELAKLGFRNIDALEPSGGMLTLLKERTVNNSTVYNVSYQCAVGAEESKDIPSDLYDSLVIAGGMGEGHIPVQALKEMIRLIKPGGTIFIVMREEYLNYVQEYVDRLEPFMNTLEKEGAWKRIGREIVPHYSFNKNGIVFSYKILSKDIS